MKIEEYLAQNPKAVKNCLYVEQQLREARFANPDSFFPDNELARVIEVREQLEKKDYHEAAAVIFHVVTNFIKLDLLNKAMTDMHKKEGDKFVRLYLYICEYFIFLDSMYIKTGKDTAGRLFAGFTTTGAQGFLGYPGRHAAQNSKVDGGYTFINYSSAGLKIASGFDLASVDPNNHDLIRITVDVRDIDLLDLLQTGSFADLEINVQVQYNKYDGSLWGNSKYKNGIVSEQICKLSDVRTAICRAILSEVHS